MKSILHGTTQRELEKMIVKFAIVKGFDLRPHSKH